IVFDGETTGLSSRYDKSIDRAAVQMQKREIIDRYESFINPHEPLSEVIKNLTGITDQMLENEREFEEVIPEFRDWVGDGIYVAHNATFDMGFIDTDYTKLVFGPSDMRVIKMLEITKG